MVQTGLQDKVAIITGANHGIGAATAKALAAEGVAVRINSLRMPPLGDTAEYNEVDPTTPGLAYYNRNRNRSAEEVVQSIRERGGRARKQSKPIFQTLLLFHSCLSEQKRCSAR